VARMRLGSAFPGVGVAHKCPGPGVSSRQGGVARKRLGSASPVSRLAHMRAGPGVPPRQGSVARNRGTSSLPSQEDGAALARRRPVGVVARLWTTRVRAPRSGVAGRDAGPVDVRGLAAALVDLVLPAECAGCGDPAHPWCPVCLAQFGPPRRPHLTGGPGVLAVGRYSGPLRSALLRFKERGRRDLARPLAALLVPMLEEVAGARVAAGSTVWLVPAPSRPAAARERGGDHVARLCRALSAHRRDARVARPLRLARRVRDSVGLDAAQRAANLAGRVRVLPAALPRVDPGDAVLLVDDVVTTGATLRTCRDALAHTGVPVAAAIVLCDATGGTQGH
jgi:predicted amidophosphoribosyltransferase